MKVSLYNSDFSKEVFGNTYRGNREMTRQNKNIDTMVIHEGYNAKDMLGSLSVPIYQTSSFEFESAEHGEAAFAGKDESYIYSRLGNPTVSILEERIAALEGGEAGLAFGSGMGAIAGVLLGLTKANDHVLCSASLYGSTYELLMMMRDKYQMTIAFSDFTDEATIREQITAETSVIYVETPVNPTMQLIDLALVAKVAKEFGVPVVVDNTFSSPYLQRPIELGCDIVVHSATKYLNGHGDVVAGLAVGPSEVIGEIRKTTQRNVGSVLSPFDAWLLLRGLKTLPLRVDRHCDNAEKMVAYLQGHAKVKQVYYPPLDESGVFEKQMFRGGGVISFEIEGGKQAAQALLNKMSFIKVAVSLGDAETLIEHPATMTHAAIPEAERVKMGITDSLIRLSVGLESPEDIWADLEQGLR